MYNTYIRPLTFDYKDGQQKEIEVNEIPAKFKEEEDNYQKRVRAKPIEVQSQEEIVVYVPPPQPPKPVQEPDPQVKENACCSCLDRKQESIQICSNCMLSLCEKCIKSPPSVKNCLICRPNLCDKCIKALKIKKVELNLRSYPIKLKDFSTMHFQDCRCEHCKVPNY